jgi:hypothetical protein
MRNEHTLSSCSFRVSWFTHSSPHSPAYDRQTTDVNDSGQWRLLARAGGSTQVWGHMAAMALCAQAGNTPVCFTPQRGDHVLERLQSCSNAHSGIGVPGGSAGVQAP